MKNYQLALALLLSLPALAWLSSSASPAAATRDPSIQPLPPEAFGRIDARTEVDKDDGITCTFYNGTEYQIESLDVEVTISDFGWAGEEHASRTWLYRCDVSVGEGRGSPLDVSWIRHGLNVEVNSATAKLVGANGYIR